MTHAKFYDSDGEECKHVTEEDHLRAMLSGVSLKRAMAYRRERDRQVRDGSLIAVTTAGEATIDGTTYRWINGDYVDRFIYERRK